MRQLVKRKRFFSPHQLFIVQLFLQMVVNYVPTIIVLAVLFVGSLCFVEIVQRGEVWHTITGTLEVHMRCLAEHGIRSSH